MTKQIIYAGIDIGGTNTKIGLVAPEKGIIAISSISTPKKGPVETYYDLIKNEITKLEKQESLTISGIGIGAPNGSYLTGTIENAVNLPWKKRLEIVKHFEAAYSVPVKIINDARAATLGSQYYGRGKEFKNFIFITLGTGLGAGIVDNGRLLLGKQGYAGEMGHVVIRPDGRLCGCKRRGCLETYVSATGMKRTIYKLLADYNGNSVFSKTAFDDLTAKMITDASHENDPIAVEAFQYTMKIFALKLADAVALFNPEAIILFGGLAHAKDKLLIPLKKYFDRYVISYSKGGVEILISSLLDKNAAILGATTLLWEDSAI